VSQKVVQVGGKNQCPPTALSRNKLAAFDELVNFRPA
jgi:hypothetical protein